MVAGLFYAPAAILAAASLYLLYDCAWLASYCAGCVPGGVLCSR